MSHNVDTESRLGESYILAERAAKGGMLPSIIMKYLPGVSRRFLNKIDARDAKLSFSRGFSSSWTRTHVGFKYSNILFKIYGNVTGDHQLRVGVRLDKVIDAFELAVCQFPVLIDEQICDISRFSCLLEKVIDHEYMISTCSTKGCKNRFIHESLHIRNKCWVCAESALLENDSENNAVITNERSSQAAQRRLRSQEKIAKQERELRVATTVLDSMNHFHRQHTIENDEVKSIQGKRAAG